jgi:hypothetical protein
MHHRRGVEEAHLPVMVCTLNHLRESVWSVCVFDGERV